MVTELTPIQESSMVNSARLVAKLWVCHGKNDEQTVKNLVKAEIGTQEECEYLFELTKSFIDALGEHF
jgi:hypothetical protein